MKDEGYSLSIPGKTFLVGEYLALRGGPSIVMATSPCFEFSWTIPDEKEDSPEAELRHPFHEQSPAGLWLAPRVEEHLSDIAGHARISFTDPYNGAGGMGASTAEFLGAWVFDRWSRGIFTEGEELVQDLADHHRNRVAPVWPSERVGGGRYRDLLDDYATVVKAASGADLVAQVTGGIAVWDGRHDEMRKYGWTLEDIEMTLLLTGKKLVTHKHVNKELVDQLEQETAFLEEMRNWVDDATLAFQRSDSDRLVAAVRGAAGSLERTGRVAEHTLGYLDELAGVTGVRAAKGCGAMGSDVILVLHDRNAEEAIVEFAAKNGLRQAGQELFENSVEIRKVSRNGNG